MAEGRQSKLTLLFTVFFNSFSGIEWMNRLTTTDGLEITFDPLLLEGDNDDQAAKNDR